MKTIKLTQGKVAFVDDADFEAVSQFKWHAWKSPSGNFYAARNIRKPDGKWTKQLLHQFLLPGPSPRIDHRDGNSLDDRRENIRPATALQNSRGFQRKRVGMTSRFRGVCWNKRAGKWTATIKANGKQIYLGYFEIEEDAARARDTATLKYYGPDAQLNFPI